MNKTRSHFHISKKINQLNLLYIYMLRHYGVKLILVFDGGFLPIKGDHETNEEGVFTKDLPCFTKIHI
jgi:hypothetical protein